MWMIRYDLSQVSAGGFSVFLKLHRARVEKERLIESRKIRILVENLFRAQLSGWRELAYVEVEPGDLQLVHRQDLLDLIHQCFNLVFRVCIRITSKQVFQLALCPPCA